MKKIKQELENILKELPQFKSLANIHKERALKAMEQAYNLGAESKWIRISQVLPNGGTEVNFIVDGRVHAGKYGEDIFGEVCFYNIPRNFYLSDRSYTVTHWQPLPTPPQPPIV